MKSTNCNHFPHVQTSLLLTLITSLGCSGGSSSSTPPKVGSVEQPVSEHPACLAGETVQDNGFCALDCRTAPDGTEYCLRSNEMPSDLEPTRKVQACEAGFFDREECKPIEYSISKDGFHLKAGDTPRIRFDGENLLLDRIKLGAYMGFGYRVEYSYPTEYPALLLDKTGFGNTSIEFRKIGSSVESSISAAQYSDNPLSQPIIDFFGIRFHLGPATKESFIALCNKVKALDDVEDLYKDSFHFVEVSSLEKYACGLSEGTVPPSIIMQCTGKDCSINEVNVSWSPAS